MLGRPEDNRDGQSPRRRERYDRDSHEKPAGQDPESRKDQTDSATEDPKAAREC
jgi:hypothetical protein